MRTAQHKAHILRTCTNTLITFAGGFHHVRRRQILQLTDVPRYLQSYRTIYNVSPQLTLVTDNHVDANQSLTSLFAT